MAGSLGQGRLRDRDAAPDLGLASGGASSILMCEGKFGWKGAGFAAGFDALSIVDTSTRKKRIE